jgi:hypothetical protein
VVEKWVIKMANDCKKGEVYSKKFKKCVNANPDPDKTWGKYIYEGGYYFEDFRATEPEQAVIDSMKKDIMNRGKKKPIKRTKKG